CLQDYNTPSAF
nr:immunoglobulin light chain junction region [Macaca mulatta]